MAASASSTRGVGVGWGATTPIEPADKERELLARHNELDTELYAYGRRIEEADVVYFGDDT